MPFKSVAMCNNEDILVCMTYVVIVTQKFSITIVNRKVQEIASTLSNRKVIHMQLTFINTCLFKL